MKRLLWIEVMRGIAATWVLIHHAEQATRSFVGVVALAGGLAYHLTYERRALAFVKAARARMAVA